MVCQPVHWHLHVSISRSDLFGKHLPMSMSGCLSFCLSIFLLVTDLDRGVNSGLVSYLSTLLPVSDSILFFAILSIAAVSIVSSLALFGLKSFIVMIMIMSDLEFIGLSCPMIWFVVWWCG